MVVLVQDAFAETQLVLFKELATVGPLPHADEGYDACLQRVAAVVVPSAAFLRRKGVVGLVVSALAGVAQHISSIGRRGQFLQHVGAHPVVAVHIHNVFSFSHIGSAVARRAEAAVLAVHDAHLRIAPGPLGQQSAAAIRRAVVDADDFVVRIGLRLQAPQAVVEV